MSSATVKMNPFPGLRPFTQEEDYLFFGREEQTIELLQRLGSNRFVAVVGTSGSGKSSLVRCGLLSELLGGKMLGAGASWEIAVTHPGGNPLALLTDALLEADLYDRKEEHARENLLATLSRSHFGLVEAIKQAGLGEGTNFLLVVDQFEEIFRFHEAGQRQQEVANEFVSLLLEAAVQKEVSIYVVLTMRSDFIGECGQFEGLAEMVNRGEFLIPRLTREQYKRVIEGPIKVAGGQIAPRLLQRLLNDLGQQADQLPCLQHALMRTWNVWTGNGDTEALDLDDYQRVGKMSQALSLHADEIYESLASDRQRELCQGIFQALTVEESNSRGIRRPQRLGRLCQILEVPADELLPIIDAYRQSGVTFLMPSPEVELTDQTIIDISHESLMRVWTRLRQWVEEETQAAGIYHRLSESAALHELGKAGLYRDPELGIALAWRESKRPNAAWAERYRPGFLHAMEFLDASQQAHLAVEQEHEAARQRELEHARTLASAERARAETETRSARRLRVLLAGTAVVAVIAVGASLVAFKFWRDADAAKQTAVLAKQAAEQSEKSAKQSAATAKSEAKRATIQETAAKAARGDSEENLARARGAIDDYMTKVSESQLLSTPGLQPLRAELLASASQFYEDILKKDPKNPDLQAGLAAAFYRVGFVRFDTGDRDQSAQAMERAAQFYTSALAIQPANAELKHGLANCWFMLGVIKMLNRDSTRSNESAKQAAQIWEELIQGGGKDLRFQKELARAYNLIGINYSNVRTQEESFLAYRKSLSIRLTLISEHPDDVQLIHGLAESFSNISSLVADPKLRLQMHLRSIDYAERAQQLRPQNVEYAMDLSGFYTSTAQILASQGRNAEAQNLSRRNLDHVARFIRKNPSVPDMRRLLPSAIALLGQSSNADAEAQAALIRDCAKMSAELPKETPEDHYIDAQAQAMCAMLVRQSTASAVPPMAQQPAGDGKKAGGDPALAALSRDELGQKMAAQLQQGFQLMQQNQPAAGYKSFQESAKYARELRRRFPVLSPPEQAALGSVFYNNACALALGGNPSAALSSLQEAVSAGFADTSQLDSDSDLATVRSLPEFKAWRKEMVAVAARHQIAATKDSNELLDQGIKALELAITAGFKDVQRLEQDPALAPLRQHAQFPKLVAQLKEAGGKVAVVAAPATGERTASGSELAQFNEDRATGYQAFGIIEISLNRTEQAGKSLDQALALRQTLAAAAPEDKQIQADLAGMRNALASLYWNTGRLAKARELFQQRIKDLERQVQGNSGDPAAGPADATQLAALTDLAAAEREFADSLAGSGLWDEATAHYAQSLQWSSKLKLSQPNQEYQEIMAPMLWLLTSTDRSYPAACERALAKYPPSSDSELVARVARLCALSPKAVADLASVLSLTEKAQGSWHGYTLGLVLYRLGRFEEAIRKIDDARQKKQIVGLGVEEFVLAMAHFQAGRQEQARSILAAVNQKTPETMGAWTHSPHNMLDVDWLVLRKEANQLIHGSPYGLDDRRRRGQAYTQLGDFAQANAELTAVIAALPDDPHSRLALARVLWEIGRKVEAIHALDQSRQALNVKWAASTGDVELWRTYAETCRLLNRPDDANEALRRAVSAQSLVVIKASEQSNERRLLVKLNIELIQSLQAAGHAAEAASARQELETLHTAFGFPPIIDSATDLLADSGYGNTAPGLTLAAIDRLIAARQKSTADNDPVNLNLLGRLHQRRAEVLQDDGQSEKDVQDAISAARQQYERLLVADPHNAAAAAALGDLLLSRSGVPWKTLEPITLSSKAGTTLTLQADGSILASGVNPDQETYTVVAKPTVSGITAIRLETKPHPSLPRGGSGRDRSGSFYLSEFTVAVARPGQPPTQDPLPIRLRSAVASIHRTLESGVQYPIQSAIDGQPSAWDPWPGAYRRQQAVFEPEPNPEKMTGAPLVIQLTSTGTAGRRPTLGRFRLSVTDDPAAFGQEEQRFAALKLADPWAKLGTAYALNGQAVKGAEAFAKGLDKAADGVAKTLIMKSVVQHAEVLQEFLKLRPEEPWLLAEMARLHAARGESEQAAAARDKARALFEQQLAKAPENTSLMHALADILLETAGPKWTALIPTEMNSAGGEKLTAEKDGSIFVSGPNPERAVYTLNLRTDLPALTAIRLETLLDARLPQGGAGRFPGNGNFHLAELTAAIVSGNVDGKPTPIEISSAMVDDQGSTQYNSTNIIDGNPNTYWDTHPRHLRNHWVVLGLKAPAKINGGSVSITLDKGITPWGQHGLGHFRLSVTDAPGAYEREEQRLAALKFTDPWTKLGAAYVLAGKTELAADLLAKSGEKEGLAAWLESNFAFDSVFDLLKDKHPDLYARFLPGSANAAAERGQVDQARTLYDRLAKLQPENGLWKERIAQLQPGVLAVWNFDLGPGQWGTSHNCDLSVKDGVLTALTTGDDPNFMSPASGLAGGKAIVLRYRTDQAFTMQVFWADSSGGLDESRHLDYPIPASSGEWAEITLPFWCQGILNTLRLDPNTASEHPLDIDSIVLRNLEPAEAWSVADWMRVIQQQPSMAQTAFDHFKQAERWNEAAEFGLQLVQQQPDDTLMWLRIAPVLVLAEDQAAYSGFCGRMVQHFSESKLPETAERVIKASLLRANSIDFAKLPGDMFAKSLDDGTVPDWLPPWGWGTRALLAYRGGDAESAVKYVAKSEEFKPAEPAHALNLAVRAMAQHQLGQADEARTALDEASQLITRLQADDKNKGHHDLFIAQILLREAEALINGKPKPKPASDQPAPQPSPNKEK